MPDAGALIPGLALALLGALFTWFTVGTQLNMRRGARLLSWVQEGLPILGDRARLRWMGNSVAAITIPDGTPPFREAEVMLVLEPRDLGAIWAFARQRARRDFFLIRLNLVASPDFAADLLDPHRWTPPGTPPLDDRLRPVPDATDPDGYDLRDDGTAPRDELRRLWQTLTVASGKVWRLSVRKDAPHLEIHVVPPDLRAAGSARLFTAVRQLADRIVGR